MKTVAVFATLVAASLAQSPPQGAAFDHALVIFLEDYDAGSFLGDFRYYTPTGVVLNNYHCVTRGSQPNHVASIAGDYFGMPWQYEDAVYNIPSSYQTVVDLLEAKKLTWKGYYEDMPSACYTGDSSATYVREYNPFISFDSINTNPSRCANIVPATQLLTDIDNGNLPNYAVYGPGTIDNGDGSNFTTAAEWLNGFLPRLLMNPKFLSRTLLLIVFDDNTDDSGLPHTPDCLMSALILGDAVPASLRNTTDSTFYTHYTLVSTLEANWGLGNLGRKDTDTTLSNVISFVATASGFKNNGISLSNMPANLPNLTETEPGFLNNLSSYPASSSDVAAPRQMMVVAIAVVALTIALM